MRARRAELLVISVALMMACPLAAWRVCLFCCYEHDAGSPPLQLGALLA